MGPTAGLGGNLLSASRAFCAMLGGSKPLNIWAFELGVLAGVDMPLPMSLGESVALLIILESLRMDGGDGLSRIKNLAGQSQKPAKFFNAT